MIMNGDGSVVTTFYFTNLLKRLLDQSLKKINFNQYQYNEADMYKMPVHNYDWEPH